MTDQFEVFQASLRRCGSRVTRERIEIFRLLMGAEVPMSRSGIIAELKGSGIHGPTVYRTIELFVSLGIIQPLTSVSGELTYELLPPFAIHHHHFRCITCGVTLPISVDDEETIWNPDEAEKLPGVPLYHQMDVFGNCFACLKQTPLEIEGAVH